MADGNAARRLNLSFMDESLDDLVRQQAELDARLASQGYVKALPVSGSAGLNEGAPKSRLGFGKAAAGPAGAPVKPKKVSPSMVRGEFDNLTFWDRMMKTPEWQRGVQGIGEIREAEVARAAKPDTMQAAADAAEAEAAELDKEADALRKRGKISEAKTKTDAAYAKRQEAAEAALVKARTNEVAEAKKKAKDAIANAKREKGKAWDAKKTNMKNIAKGGAATALLGGAAYLGGKLMSDAEERRRSDPTKVAVDDVVMRVISGEEVSSDDIYMLQQFYADDPEKVASILRSGETARGGAVSPEPPPAAPSDDAGPGAMPPVGPRIENLPFLDVAYREGAEKPEVVTPKATYDAEVMRAILEDPEGGPEIAQWYKDDAEAEDLLRRNNAFLDASIENTAAASGAPDWFMDYLRGQGEYSRAADAGNAPVDEENLWNKYISGPVRKFDQDTRDLITERAGDGPNPLDYTFGGAFKGVTFPDLFAGWLQPTAEEYANMPYGAVRDGVLSPTFYAGVLDDPKLSAAYGEMMRSIGGEPLRGPDQITAPITQGAAPPAFWDEGVPPELSAGADLGPGTSAYDTGMPGMEDLKRLEEIGALGRNPDGSNMTVAQYIQQGNLAGAGMEAGLPMFAGSPMPPRMGTMIPEDPRLGPMPEPNLPQLPMAPSDLPISVTPPQGMPGDFLDENAADFRRADMEWQKMATMLGLTPTGEPTSADRRAGARRAADMPAVAPPVGPPPIVPGGAGDQWAMSDILGSPAYAGEAEDAQAAEEIARYNAEVADRDAAVSAIVDQDEVLNPRGQASVVSDGGLPPLSMGAPVSAPATTGASAAPAEPVAATPGGRPAPGAVGDFNTTRERGDAGLAEDARAAEEELNWINRMMRDKLGMTDASQRAKAAEALVSFGSTVLASKGDSWQSIGEGLQAGLGSVLAANDEEAAAVIAAQEAAQEESRWREEMALKRLQARSGGGADANKYDLVGILTEQIIMQNPGITEAEARAEAERYYGVKSKASWEGGDALLSAMIAGMGEN